VSLAASYEHCRVLHRTHGRSYYLATRLLPGWKRRHVHALYGFTRHTDDIVDGDGGPAGPEAARRLDAWEDRVTAALDSGDGGDDPILPALVHTVAVFGIDRDDLRAFLRSMRMDLTVGAYRDYAALCGYMEGSAAVIGTMMLPVLLAGPEGPAPAARLAALREPARALGLGFQLTNFIRDVREDLDRDRVYLPQVDLDRFGVTRDDLAADSAGPDVRRLVAYEIERARAHYRAAEPGIAALPPVSRRCIRLAAEVYGGILTEIERAGHDVLSRRAVVPTRRRLAAVGRVLVGAA
jgi:phytoene synthase